MLGSKVMRMCVHLFTFKSPNLLEELLGRSIAANLCPSLVHLLVLGTIGLFKNAKFAPSKGVPQSKAINKILGHKGECLRCITFQGYQFHQY